MVWGGLLLAENIPNYKNLPNNEGERLKMKKQLLRFVICSMLDGGDEKQSASETTNTPIEKASQFATQINAIATMTNCLVLNTHYEYALDSRWKAATEFEKRDADAYMDAVGKRLRAVCD